MRLGKSPLRNSQNGLAIHKKISVERNVEPFLSTLIFGYSIANSDTQFKMCKVMRIRGQTHVVFSPQIQSLVN